MKAVEYHRVQAVQDCLGSGADPNYVQLWEGNSENQPTTPLRMVMFCISDALLEEDDLKQFAEIAALLLHYGADPKPAMKLAEARYGKYDPSFPDSPFMDVWRIVARATRENN